MSGRGDSEEGAAVVAGEQGHPGSPQVGVGLDGEVIGSCCPDLIVSGPPWAS